MKKVLAGLALIAAAYFASAYNVSIKISENQSAACDMDSGVCD